VPPQQTNGTIVVHVFIPSRHNGNRTTGSYLNIFCLGIGVKAIFGFSGKLLPICKFNFQGC
jgi:hypothetical protein